MILLMGNLEKIKNISIAPLQTSSLRKLFLLTYSERNFEANQSIVDLLQCVQQSDSIHEACRNYNNLSGKSITEKQFLDLVDKCINPIIDSNKSTRSMPFLYQKELIPSEKMARLSTIFKSLFKPPIIFFASLAIIFFEVLFFLNVSQLDILDISTSTLLLVLILFLCSSLIHELGHASACQFFGINHGGVGLGIYLNFPVFYTDVSGVWKLPAPQRLIVNLGGVYFQLLFLIPLIVIYYYYPTAVLSFFITAINLNLLITLNPFFKFDGYWIMTDLLGVPNLSERSSEYFKYIWLKIKRKKIETKPFLMQIKMQNRIFMTIYTVVVNVFFAFYFFYVIPSFLYHFFKEFPSLIKQLIDGLSVGITPEFAFIQRIFTQLLFFALILFVLYRFFQPLIRHLSRKRAN